jgi:FkbM family methyltransferase
MPATFLPMIIRAAFWWNHFGIRGKAAIPKAIGRMWHGENLFISTRHKGMLSVDTSNLDVYASIFNAGGQWDAHVMQTCEKVLRPGDVYYDIGSNSGIFAIDAALAIPDLTIVAFEPQPSLAHHIRQSIKANKLEGIKCFELILGEKDGEKILYLTSHSIHASIVPRESRFRELKRPMRSLDSLVISREISPPDVIKIDVEGAEMAVFGGALKTLEMNPPTIVFEADENLLRVNLRIEDLFDCLLQAAPYRFYRIDLDGSLLMPERPYGSGNYLALAPRHFGRIEGTLSKNIRDHSGGAA